MFQRGKKPQEATAPLKCSFCGKSQHDVRKLIAGPTVYICDECVEVCVDILADDRYKSDDDAPDETPSPNSQPKTWLPSNPVCNFCGEAAVLDTALMIENRTLLCEACVQVISAAARLAGERRTSDE